MIVVGLCSIAWALLVWQWQDPFTALYTKYQQHKLASTFAHEFADYRPPDTRAGDLGAARRRRPSAPGSPRRPGPTGSRSTRASRSAD